MKRAGRLQEFLITGLCLGTFQCFCYIKIIGGWSLTTGDRTWRFGQCTFFLSVYDISQITVNVEISFSDVIFSGLLVGRVCPLLI